MRSRNSSLVNLPRSIDTAFSTLYSSCIFDLTSCVDNTVVLSLDMRTLDLGILLTNDLGINMKTGKLWIESSATLFTRGPDNTLPAVLCCPRSRCNWRFICALVLPGKHPLSIILAQLPIPNFIKAFLNVSDSSWLQPVVVRGSAKVKRTDLLSSYLGTRYNSTN